MSVSLLLALPLLLLDWANIWVICAAALLLGCVQVMDSPARQMFLRDLVGKDELRRGVGIYSTSLGMARIAGPALSGLLIAMAGEGVVFLVNAVSYLAVVAALIFIGRRPDALFTATDGTAATRIDRRGGWLRGLPPVIWPALILACLLGGFAYQFHVTGPLMVSTVFGDGSITYGIVGTCAAVGAVVGSFVSSVRAHPTAREFIAWAGLFGVAALAAAASPNPIWFGTALVVIGAATTLFTTTTVVFVQRETSDHKQGPALAAYNAAYLGFVPLGGIVVGVIATYGGVRWGIALPAVTLLLAAALAAGRLRSAPGRALGQPPATPATPADRLAQHLEGAS
jgi:MFS family permease